MKHDVQRSVYFATDDKAIERAQHANVVLLRFPFLDRAPGHGHDSRNLPQSNVGELITVVWSESLPM